MDLLSEFQRRSVSKRKAFHFPFSSQSEEVKESPSVCVRIVSCPISKYKHFLFLSVSCMQKNYRLYHKFCVCAQTKGRDKVGEKISFTVVWSLANIHQCLLWKQKTATPAVEHKSLPNKGQYSKNWRGNCAARPLDVDGKDTRTVLTLYVGTDKDADPQGSRLILMMKETAECFSK